MIVSDDSAATRARAGRHIAALVTFAALAAATAPTGCAHGGVIIDGEADEAVRAHITQVVMDTSRARGLAPRRPIRVRILDEPRFLASLKSKDRRKPGEGATLVAFGLIDPTLDARRIIDEVVDEQVVGFYDPSSRALHLRRGVASGVGADLLLSHEAEHALQDQWFPDPDRDDDDDGAGDDRRLARSALLEGDAVLAMIAVGAARSGVPLEEATARAARALGTHPDEMAFAGAARLEQAPPIIRTLLLFPYLSGFAFVETIRHAGGLALLDRVLRAPPLSTEQVLHPERYAAGDAPRVIPDARVPEGWRAVERGTLGELGIRVMLGMCRGVVEAEEAASGWAGDRYQVIERDGTPGRLAVLWSTVWDDGSAARRFEDAMQRHVASSCWGLPTRPGGHYHADPSHVLARKGARVLVARGLDAAELPDAMTSLLLVEPRPAPPSVRIDLSRHATPPPASAPPPPTAAGPPRAAAPTP